MALGGQILGIVIMGIGIFLILTIKGKELMDFYLDRKHALMGIFIIACGIILTIVGMITYLLSSIKVIVIINT